MRSSFRLFSLAALLAALFFCTCGGGEPLMILYVSGVPVGTTSLLVSVTSDGKAAVPVTVEGRLDHFSLRLPAGAAGPWTLDIDAIGASGCSAATVHDERPAPPEGPVVLTLVLTPRAQAACPLRVSRVGPGGGTVESSPAGLRCGDQCTAFFPAGAKVSLRVHADRASYSTGLDGPCAGALSCELTVNGAATLRAAFGRKSCVADQLCYEVPLVTRAALRRSSARNADDIWLVGASGTILHYDGTIVSGVSSGTVADLRGVFALGPRDVWAVGAGGAILHFDGDRWLAVPSGTTQDLDAVWASGPGDVWAVGNRVITHFDGKVFTSQTTDAVLHGVWGSGPRNVIAVGERATVLQWAGSGWSPLPEVLRVTGEALYDVWGSGPLDIWAVGARGTIIHWDGNMRWAPAQSGVSDDLRAIAGGGDVIWVVGAMGATVVRSGGAWAAADRLPVDAFGVTGAAGRYLAVGDRGLIAVREAAAWRPLAVPQQAGDHGAALSATDAWTVDWFGGAYHYDGDRWSKAKTGSSNSLSAVLASAPDDVWFFGTAGNVERGAVYHWNGDTITVERGEIPSTRYYGAWASGPEDLWAVGGKGGGGDVGPVGPVILHGRGKPVVWEQVSTGLMAPNMLLYGIWGSGPQDIWIVGGSGVVLHGGPAGFQAVASNTMATLKAVWGRSAKELWIVGEGGTVLRGDGRTLTPVSGVPQADLEGVGGAADGSVLVLGAGGTLLRGDGQRFAAVPLNLAPNVRLLSLFGVGDERWISSTDGLFRYLR